MAAKNDINRLGAAIERALDTAPVADVLSVLTGAFVSLTLEVVRRNGHDASGAIKVDGGPNRDITIHAPKAQAAASICHMVRVTDSNGSYTTNTVKGKRASCTHSAKQAAEALARKLAPEQRWELREYGRDGNVVIYELAVSL